MAVIDTFDVLTSDRLYRKAMASEKAIGILLQEAEEGKLDKFVVQKLEELIK
jgi:HD-GYP domain-containing protein (c-di-GMP phosphodiesterase class II)